MPVQFLSQADHDRLNRFPEEITHEELNSFFWLSHDDRQFIASVRGDHNRLGFAVQIGCLRYLGFFPEDLSQIPHVVIEYVAAHLGVIPELLAFYGKRTSTQRHHQRQIQKLLGYRRASAANIVELEQWLLERALEHDKPTLLFTMACEFLKQHKIIRIGTTRLAHKVSKARQQAQIASYQSLQPLLTQECCSFLDKLLTIDENLSRTRLSWLQRTPTGDNPKQILETLDKIAFLHQHNDAYVDYFGKSYKRVRHFSRRFLATLQFHTRQDDQGLLKALQLVREIHAGNRRKLPDDAPTAFIPDAWLPYVIQLVGLESSLLRTGCSLDAASTSAFRCNLPDS
jgi:hypothetical protein